jgi:SAM-dependent methyltransferase
MAALKPTEGERILDVGCGAGQTILQLAEAVGPTGEVVGIDISPRVLGIARERSAALFNVEFIQADAQTHAFAPESFDAIFSRFGVMAFADPTAAFRNLRGALAPGGRLAFVCWRALDENELDSLPLRAAGLEHLADETPFSFQDPVAIRRVLGAAGFQDIDVTPHDQPVICGDLNATLSVVLNVGALGAILRQTPTLRRELGPAVRRALQSRDGPGGVSLGAATWIVGAVA